MYNIRIIAMRICPVCGSELKGRRDQIYCSANCKSAAQYENRIINEELFFRIDKQLKINRKVLKKYNRKGSTKLRAETLFQEGFNPNFFTHFWKNNKNQVYLFCYEYGFLKLKDKENEKYLLIQWQEYMNKGHFN